MIVYRISTLKWANDLSGNRAKLYGGRWNSIGMPMLYTSENISLAMLEILMNASSMFLKNPFSIVKIEIPDKTKIQFFKDDLLPKDWNLYPHPLSTQILGDEWLQTQNTLLLKVPSSANRFEHNVLLNPLHEDFRNIRIQNIKTLSFEKRLFKM